MEFNQKLQELRKQKKMTQDELANKLFVSRTAVSKWEQGKGYPSIDTLKNISKIFSVSIDELLSSNELLNIAEEDVKQSKNNFFDLVFGLCDVSTLLLLFLPFFAQRENENVTAVSLLSLNGVSVYIKIFVFLFIAFTVLLGIVILALQNTENKIWNKNKIKISILLNIASVLFCVLSLMPYAAVFLLFLLIFKVLLLIKK